MASTLCRGKLWKDIEVHYLLQNTHLERTPESVEHAKWILETGSGSNLDENEIAQIPEQMCINDKTIDSLIKTVYPEIEKLRMEIKMQNIFLIIQNTHVHE